MSVMQSFPLMSSITTTDIIGRLARRRLSQAALAAQANIHPSTLNRYLRGRIPIGAEALDRVSAALVRLEAADDAAEAARAKALAS